MNFRYVLSITVLFVMTVSSCREKGNKNLNQGEIHYKIDYKGVTGFPINFLPNSLVVSFKDDKILFEMNGIGNSGILNLTNPEKGIFDTYFTLVATKYYYAAEYGEVYPGFESMDGMILTKTSKSAVICGFNCNNAEITFPADREKVYNIWYTDEIKIKSPNTSTPFNQIDGVLMNFCFLMGTTELQFTAETVYKKEIPDNTFERREKYKRVSKEEIVKFINMVVSL